MADVPSVSTTIVAIAATGCAAAAEQTTRMDGTITTTEPDEESTATFTATTESGDSVSARYLILSEGKGPKLAKLIIKNFEDWVRMGAPDPRASKPTKEELASQVDWDSVRDRRAGWWSFRPSAVYEVRVFFVWAKPRPYRRRS